MAKVVTAEYDAANQILSLDEPLEGVKDREKVTPDARRAGTIFGLQLFASNTICRSLRTTVNDSRAT